MRILLLVILLSIAPLSIALGQGSIVNFFEPPYSEESDDPLATWTPPVPEVLEDITDSLSNYTVGQESDHQIGFKLPAASDDFWGWLRGRYVVMTFPPQFDLSSIDSVSYHDTDGDCQDDNDPHCDPEISAIYVFSQSVAVKFKHKFPGPHGPDYAYLKVHGIGNSTIAKDYEIVVRITNIIGRTVAGPNSSTPFYLLPDLPVSIGIIPSEDLAVTTGTLIPFSAAMVDQYGNRVSELDVDWGIDPTHDPIGSTTGPLFLATTVGVGRVTASAGEIFAYSGFITVTAQSLASLEISWPDYIKAGQPFEIYVSNARDQSGMVFTGQLMLHGGEIAPDGTEPFLSAVNVVQGQGMAPAVLYSAGANDIRLEASGFDSTVTLVVLPGQLASLEFDIGETQFLNHNFVDEPTVTVVDPYGNTITDFSESGHDFSLIADDGTIFPDLLPAENFVEGVATLGDYQYWGTAGKRLITILTVNQSEEIASSSEVFINGPKMVIDESTPLPDYTFQTWTIYVTGRTINPGNISPIELSYMANFDDYPDIYPLSIRAIHCIPLPGDLDGCKFGIVDSAYMPVGMYDEFIMVSALYEYDGAEIIVYDFVENRVFVGEFEKINVELVSATDLAYAEHYSVPLEYKLTNANNLSGEIELTLNFWIYDGVRKYLKNGTTFLFNWENEVQGIIDFHFDQNLQEGHYNYGVDIVGVGPGNPPDLSGLLFQRELLLFDSVNIVPRATFAVVPSSVTPNIVNSGASVPFSFDLDVDTHEMIFLRGNKTKLTLTNGGINSSAYLAEENYLIESGTAHLTTQPLLVPSSWQGKPITAILSLVGIEGGFLEFSEDVVFNPNLTITAPAELSVLSVEAISPNVPYINTNQSFSITGQIVNSSLVDTIGTVVASLITDGASTLPPSVVIPKISPGDTVDVEFNVTASTAPNPGEHFYMQVDAEGITVNDGPHNNLVMIIQTPPELSILAKIVGHSGEIAFIDYEESFEISANAVNFGLGAFSGGRLHLTYNGPGDFQITPVEIDSLSRWSLISPAENIASRFTVSWLEIPIDLNRGEMVVIPGEPVELQFAVRASTTQLILHADGFNNRPLQRGIESKLFDLTFENITNDSRNVVGMNSLAIDLTDRDGNVIQPELLTDTDGSNFYLDGTPVATPAIRNGQLYYTFDPLPIQPGELVTLEYRLKPHSDLSIEFFDMRLAGENFSAEFIAGPRIGQPVSVSGLLDRAFEVSIPQAIISEEFASSFKNYPNPFNPRNEATELRYFLAEDSDVKIHIYTQTGEKVRQFSFSAGSNGGQAGINSGIYWDGYNGNGDEVLNGIYIALIEVASGNLTAKLKMAVVK